MAETGLGFLPAILLARRIRTKELSPVEVAQAALARMDATEPALNAFAHRDDAGVLAEARAAERKVMSGEALGPLHGLPVSVKDLIEARGFPCSYGSLTMEGHLPAEDAPAVARLRAAGAVILGKTTTSEFGLRGYTESRVHGLTRNPWDVARTPGGSSGGAAASVAAGVNALALGTDGGGSVRAPCALTGLAGIKAQHGRVPVWPASATPTLAHVGPIARTIAEAAFLLQAIAGPDLRDHTSLLPPLPRLDPEGPLDAPGLRVAFSPTLGYARVDPEVADLVADAVHRLQALFPRLELVEEVCPDPGWMLGAEFVAGVSARVGDEVEREPCRLDPVLHEAVLAFRKGSIARFAEALRARIAHRERLRLFFERYDLLLTPTTPVAAWPLGSGIPPGLEDAPVWVFFTYPFNLTGQPAASVPAGRTAAGLPVGLQIVARPLEEPLLVRAAHRIEQALGPIGHPPPPFGP
jgi:aspartyl-tRNA(Asn)/glutamyl-tRNA(Gln) amidotransferase subunit A